VKRALLVVVALGLAAPAAAFAHASLGTAVPGSMERLEQSPSRVVLRFSQVIAAIPNGIVVRDAGGRIVSGEARLGADRRSLVAELRPLPRGAYTVRWQTMSVADGHVVAGLYTFGVGVAAPPPTQAVGAQGPGTAEKVVRWLSYLGLAVLAGGLAFRLVALPRVLPERLDQAFFAIVGVATIVVVDAGILALLLRADAALQLPFDRFLYADLSPFAEGTRFGAAWVWMTLGTAVVGCLLTLAWLRRSREPLWAALALALAVGAGFSLSGHSASEPGAGVASIVADWVHIAAASVWIGGLVMLAVLGWRLERGDRQRAFLRFSSLAAVLVGLVLAAGVYLGVLRLPTLADLWTTGYGRVLLVKIALVLVALAWGAAHHFLVRPRLARGRELPGGRVGRSLLGESLVGVAVLLVAALLVNTSPPPQEPAGGSVEAAVSGR
jgi:copper transport protein